MLSRRRFLKQNALTVVVATRSISAVVVASRKRLAWICNHYRGMVPMSTFDIGILVDDGSDGFTMQIAHKTLAEASAEQECWLAGFVVGPPRATSAHSQAQLAAWDMVGLYRQEAA